MSELPALRRPVMITAFRGWNDGGQAATVAAGYLVQQWDATRFADIDPEACVDFQAVRPTVALDEGLTRRIEWPENALYYAPIPGADRDAVILLGVEPNYRWRAFTELVIGLARDLGIHNVRVSCVVPGAVRTPRQMRLWFSPEEEARTLDQQCLKARVEPHDIAAMVLFLASDDARMCTGHEYFVDAGWR